MVQDGAVKERNFIGTMQSTNGFNSVYGNQGIISQNKTLNCRICLEEHQLNEHIKQPFVKPCKCSGSLQYVHQSCLLSWLNTIVQKKIEDEQNLQIIHCQICQEGLSLEYRKRYVWRSCPSIKNLINNFRTHFIICIGFITFAILSMGAIAYLQKVIKGANPSEDTSLKIIFYIGWFLLAISLIIWTIKLFKNFFIKRQIYVSKVESKPLILQIKQRISSANQKQDKNISQELKFEQIKKKGQNQMQICEPQTQIRLKKFKVLPVKPAIQNESQDYMQNQIINDNINKQTSEEGKNSYQV